MNPALISPVTKEEFISWTVREFQRCFMEDEDFVYVAFSTEDKPGRQCIIIEGYDPQLEDLEIYDKWSIFCTILQQELNLNREVTDMKSSESVEKLTCLDDPKLPHFGRSIKYHYGAVEQYSSYKDKEISKVRIGELLTKLLKNVKYSNGYNLLIDSRTRFSIIKNRVKRELTSSEIIQINLSIGNSISHSFSLAVDRVNFSVREWLDAYKCQFKDEETIVLKIQYSLLTARVPGSNEFEKTGIRQLIKTLCNTQYK